jgi:hypothetical protein
MAFDFNSFSRHGGTTPAPSWWTYQTDDTWDVVTATGYFNSASTSVNVNDFIVVRANVTTFMLRVTAVGVRTVTVVREDFVAATGIGSATFASTVDVVATLPDTAYQVPFNVSITNSGGIALNDLDNTKIEFAESGTYLITGNIQLFSDSASSKTFYFFPSINGLSTANKSVRYTVHENNSYKSIGVSSSLALSAGDYIQANYAVSDVNAWMDAAPATAFAPATNAIQISIIKF